MRISARLQLLTCLMLCASSAQSIMVKYGTNDGPIVPPTPEPQVPLVRPTRAPAPVWEERSSDSPDPNAQWRPQLFVPQPRYTQVVYNNPAPVSLPLNNAQQFVNSYIPINRHAVKAPPLPKYFTPSQFLSSQALPGYGLAYFLPKYINDRAQPSKHDDGKYNYLEANNVEGGITDSASDLQWKYEKDATRRAIRNIEEVVAVPTYQRPVYVHPRHR
ncbi:hypothetical protein K1T71_004372 [Dendrolimus kikuchii]|uniref:Uncharacterized protein n=1 Tax=Dendrolimus kikuchii TaxID=765133 RepID=A0ACC1D7H8_9NEOP|nr:hypothetical protein K1T71_004372 [Dendrolimus kikuchii]